MRCRLPICLSAGCSLVGLWIMPVSVSMAAPSPDKSIDKSRLIVRLVATPTEMTKMAAGQTGRPAFDRITFESGVRDVHPVFTLPPATHRLAKLARAQRLGDWVLLEVPEDIDPDRLREQLLNSGDVEIADFDGYESTAGAMLTPSDPYFSTHQYALRNTGVQPPEDPGTSGADAEMEAAWGITTGDSNIVLAIIDTGLDFAHPEFDGRIWINQAEAVGLDGIDDDSNGFVDDINGWDFVHNDADPTDDQGHGTHLGGIAAATGDNGIGIAGMDWNCRLMIIKSFDSTTFGTSSNAAMGITYAVNNGAHVLNNSWGSPANFPAIKAAISYAISAGAVVVAAMHNQDTSQPYYPAAYDSVISVGATNSDDHRAQPFCFGGGSNYGPHIDVCAAGENVFSTLPSWQSLTQCFPHPVGYSLGSGTSMATPQVAGLATLILSLRPDYTADSVRRLIRRGAEDQVGLPSEDTPGFDIYYGYGRINGRITLQALVSPFPPILTVPGAQSVAEGDTLTFQVSAFDSNLTDDALAASSLSHAVFTDHGNGTGTLVYTPVIGDVGGYAIDFVATDGILSDSGSVAITVLPGCACDCHADPASCDHVQDVLDVVQTINVAFRGQAAILDPNGSCPYQTTDVDCSQDTGVLDVVHMINVAFRGMNAAIEFCAPCP